jgi:hypothetical protein
MDSKKCQSRSALKICRCSLAKLHFPENCLIRINSIDGKIVLLFNYNDLQTGSPAFSINLAKKFKEICELIDDGSKYQTFFIAMTCFQAFAEGLPLVRLI